MEFGLRRAQGPDAGLYGARAAIIGGCVGTSNVLAGQLFDVPVMGTHAHSWIMSFEDEYTAFKTYANLYLRSIPDHCPNKLYWYGHQWQYWASGRAFLGSSGNCCDC